MRFSFLSNFWSFHFFSSASVFQFLSISCIRQLLILAFIFLTLPSPSYSLRHIKKMNFFKVSFPFTLRYIPCHPRSPIFPPTSRSSPASLRRYIPFAPILLNITCDFFFSWLRFWSSLASNVLIFFFLYHRPPPRRHPTYQLTGRWRKLEWNDE